MKNREKALAAQKLLFYTPKRPTAFWLNCVKGNSALTIF
jgi:hypothetical protein